MTEQTPTPQSTPQPAPQQQSRFARVRSGVLRKRVLVPTIAAVAVLGAGGSVWAATAADRDELSGTTFDRASSAALEVVGEGRVTGAETSDDRGVAYEVEVTREDGTEVDVDLDESYAVVGQPQEEGRDDDSDDSDDDDSGRDDDRRLSADEIRSAERAALAEVRGATVTDVEAGDSTDAEAYEVELVESDGTEWKVELDADFGVLEKHIDD